FNKKSFFSESLDLEENLKEYCQGYFHQHNQHWHVFLFSRLLQNPHYMNASTKFIN
ncbi:chemotaxis protein CheW, partial [Acinetobacter baumannii]